MKDDKQRRSTNDDTPEELKGRPEGSPGMSDYDEAGGAGLEPRPDDAVIGGGVSGGDSDPIRERVSERTNDDSR
jgi:hypothetical protein